MASLLITGATDINPLADFNLTFDHFYQFVKRSAGPEKKQLIQIRAAAEPLDLALAYPWFSYYSYLLKMDTRIEPQPVTDKSTEETFGLTDGQLSYEYGRFLDDAVSLIELTELSASVRLQIAGYDQQIHVLQEQAAKLVEEDTVRWPKYAAAMGFNVGDGSAFSQWWLKLGNGSLLSTTQEKIEDLEGAQEKLRLGQYVDADQKAIFDTFKQFKSFGSRLRWPRIPDTRYKVVDGTPPFTPDYLFKLATGNSPLFADRHYFFPGSSLDKMISTTLGGFSETLRHSAQSTSSISSDWHVSGTGGFAWFSASVDASEQTALTEDLKNTQSITISCKSLQKIPFDAAPWFNPGLFNSSIVLANPKKFLRYFGPNGTLRYYPASLLIARGMKLEFESSSDYTYDYKKKFSMNSSGSFRFFGVSIGAGGGHTSNQADQTVESNGHHLTLDDGESNFRVIGYIVNQADGLHTQLSQDLDKRFAVITSLRKSDEG